MPDSIQILLASLPEAIGGLAVAAILAVLGLIVKKLRSRKTERPTELQQQRIAQTNNETQLEIGFGVTALDKAVEKVKRL